MVQECLNCVDLRKRIVELEDKIFSLSKKRGVDIVSVDREDDFWHIVSHRDVDGVVETFTNDVPHSNVLLIREILRGISNSSGKFSFSGRSRELASVKQLLVKRYKFINEYGHFYNNKEYFGSRSKYMDTYYFPIKILDYFNFIEYTNSGKISLLKKFFEVD